MLAAGGHFDLHPRDELEDPCHPSSHVVHRGPIGVHVARATGSSRLPAIGVTAVGGGVTIGPITRLPATRGIAIGIIAIHVPVDFTISSVLVAANATTSSWAPALSGGLLWGRRRRLSGSIGGLCCGLRSGGRIRHRFGGGCFGGFGFS